MLYVLYLLYGLYGLYLLYLRFVAYFIIVVDAKLIRIAQLVDFERCYFIRLHYPEPLAGKGFLANGIISPTCHQLIHDLDVKVE